MSRRGWRALQPVAGAAIAHRPLGPTRGRCLRAFATQAPIDGELKPSNYGQPLFQSHPHLCEHIPRSLVSTLSPEKIQ